MKKAGKESGRNEEGEELYAALLLVHGRLRPMYYASIILSIMGC